MQVAISRNDQTNDCRFNIHQFAKVNTEAGEPMFMTLRHASKPCLHCIASQTRAYWGLPTNLGKSGLGGSGKAGNKSRLVATNSGNLTQIWVTKLEHSLFSR